MMIAELIPFLCVLLVRTVSQDKTDDETDKHKSKRGVVDEIFHVFLLCFP